MSGTIPKIIHQTWKTKDVPEKWRESQESWKALEKDGFVYKLWTDEDNRNLIKRFYPWFLSTFDGYEHGIQRADAVRYFILHKENGLYCDLDICCKRERFLAMFEMVKHREIAISSNKEGNGNGDQSLTNAFMMSRKGSNFWPIVWDLLLDPFKVNPWKRVPATLTYYFKILFTTGPGIVSDAAKLYKGDFYRIPASLTQPGDNRTVYPFETNDSAVRLLEGSSWHQGIGCKFFKVAGDAWNVWKWICLGFMIFFALVCVCLWYLWRRCRGVSSQRSKSKAAHSYTGQIRVI